MSSYDWEPIGPAPSRLARFIPIHGNGAGEGQGPGTFRDLKDPGSAQDVAARSTSDPALVEMPEPVSQCKREEIEREAFEKGFAQGERAGRELAARSAETALRSLVQAADLLRDASGQRRLP